MVFPTRSSFASAFTLTIFFTLAFTCVSAVHPVSSGFMVPKIRKELFNAARQNEQPVYTGVFIICEQHNGQGPEARIFTNTGPNARYSVLGNCSERTLIRGTANGKTETNHSRLLNFPGLYDYFELGAACAESEQVYVEDSTETGNEIVFSCDPGSAATYVLFGTEILS